MEIIIQPSSLCLAGSMNHFVLSTDKDVSFVLTDESNGDVIVKHVYSPSDTYRIEIDLKNIVLPLLSFNLQDISSPYQQTGIVKKFSARIAEVGTGGESKNCSFTVIRAGVDHFDGDAESFLQQNFLTWQPNVKTVTYYTPEFLTYYAVVGVTVRCKAYFEDGTTKTFPLTSISAGECWTIPVQYAIIAGKCGNKLPQYYDVWADNGDGERQTYIQRYVAGDMRSEEEEWILFENSLGGVDTFRAYGDSENTAKHTHNVAEIEEDFEEYRVDTTREFKKNTGFLGKRERVWLLDFFPSTGKYVYTDDYLRRIVVTDSDVTYKAKELPSSYNFTYKYADARPYLNLPRTELPQKVLDIKIPELGSFTVAPRLAEFPRLTLSGGALFLVQNPYSEEWTVTTAIAIMEYIVDGIAGNYTGNGGIGHTHPNVTLLNSLRIAEDYLLVNGNKLRAGYADVAKDLSEDSPLWEKFLRKDIADIAQKLITFLEGTQVGQKFTSGLLGDGGIFRKNADGKTYIEADKLYIRMKAYFDSVEIRRYFHSGGNRVASPAGAKLVKVDCLDADGNTTTDDTAVVKYRCYFRGSDGDDNITNDFTVGDQARCHTANVTDGSLSQKDYWRLVVGKSDSPDADNEHWIDLSNLKEETIDGIVYSGYMEGSDAPQAQDDVFQLGNVNDSTRTGAIIEFVSGDSAPAYQIFQGIGFISDASLSVVEKRTIQYSTSGCCYIDLGYSGTTGHAYMNVYGDAYIGDRDGNSYVKYDSLTKLLTIKARVSLQSTVDDSGMTLDEYIKNSNGQWTKEEIEALINGNDTLNAIKAQADGQIETWYGDGVPTLSNAPADSWTTDDDKAVHVGDYYYDNLTGKVYHFTATTSDDTTTYSWTENKNSAVQQALADAKDARDLADGKRRIFINTPTAPYEGGDLWVNATYIDSDGNYVYKDEILRCKAGVERSDGYDFNIDDWCKAANYTDDTSLQSFIDNTYGKDKEGFQNQLDGKVETWFYEGEALPNTDAPSATANEPASGWTDADTRKLHVGDLYLDTQNGAAYKYVLSDGSYLWQKTTDESIKNALQTASEAQDTADHKRRVFIGSVTSEYDEGDLWVNATYPSGNTVTDNANHKYYNAILRCNAGIKKRALKDFKIEDWSLASSYTDDSSWNKWVDTIFSEYKDQLDSKVEIWYGNGVPAPNADTTTVNSPASEWSGKEDDHVDDLYYDLDTGRAYRYTDSHIWSEIEDKATKDSLAAISKTAGSKAQIFTDIPKPPYNVGDMWVNASYFYYQQEKDSYGGIMMTQVTLFHNDLARCKTARAEGDSYTIQDDWELASKYTDDSTVNAFIAKAQGVFGKDLTGYEYLVKVLAEGTTDIDGGVVLTNVLGMKDADRNVTAGMSGVIDASLGNGGLSSIAAWYGGQMRDLQTWNDNTTGQMHYVGKGTDDLIGSEAKTLFRMDGSGYIASGNISWDDTGRIEVANLYLANGESIDSTLALLTKAFAFTTSGSGTTDDPYTVVSVKPQAAFSNIYIGTYGDDNCAVATHQWAKGQFISKEFFNALFTVYDADGNAVEPNNDTGKTIDNVKAMFGFWTDQYLSALGKSSNTSESSTTVDLSSYATMAWVTSQNYLTSATLAALGDVSLAEPADGQVLTYDGTQQKWVNKTGGKTQVFTDTPKPPYNVGDIWVNASYFYYQQEKGSSDNILMTRVTLFHNDLARCKTARAEGDSYTIQDDWELASKYTDDSTVNAFITKAQGVFGKDLTGYEYLVEVFAEGTTGIDGGVVLTNVLGMKDTDSNVTAGMSGVIDASLGNGGLSSIAAWYGGQMRDLQTWNDSDDTTGQMHYVSKGADDLIGSEAKTLFRMDGSGYIASGNISWDDTGRIEVANLYMGTYGDDNYAVATHQWANGQFISKEFFNALFTVYDADGNAVEPNNDTGKTIDNIKAMFGFWTDQYLSALGKSSNTSESSTTVDLSSYATMAWVTSQNYLTSATLAALGDVSLAEPADGQVLTYDGTQQKWVNKAADMSAQGTGGTLYGDRFGTDDFETALRAALTYAKANGFSTVDMTYFTGTWNCGAKFDIDFPVTIRLGNVTLNQADTDFFDITSNNVRIEGVNRQTDSRATTDGNATVLMLNGVSTTSLGGYHIYSRGAKNCQYRNLVLKGTRTSTGRQADNESYPIDGTGGIYIEKGNPGTTTGGNTCNATVLENLLIDGTKAHGIYIDTPILSVIRNVRISSTGGHGVFITGGTTLLLDSVYVASARYAGFCFSGVTYCSVLNSVAENCGCAWWIRSCFNMSIFSPGVENTYNLGNNPWSNSYKITSKYGMNISTTDSSGNKVAISDVPNDSQKIGNTRYDYRRLFAGYAFVISGGRNIDIYSPYATGIANEVDSNTDKLTDTKDRLAYMLIMGNARAVKVSNAGFHETSSSKIPSAIKYEIRIGAEVSGLDLTYNPDNTVLPSYTSPTPVTDDESLTAPVLSLSSSAFIRNGNNIYSDVGTKGSVNATTVYEDGTALVNKYQGIFPTLYTDTIDNAGTGIALYQPKLSSATTQAPAYTGIVITSIALTSGLSTQILIANGTMKQRTKSILNTAESPSAWEEWSEVNYN